MPITLSPSSPPIDLITTSRAILEPALADLNSTSPSSLPPLISAATAAIERACKRQFAARDYSLYLSIGPRVCDWIALPHFPVISVSRLASNPKAALTISNTDSTDHQRAAVSMPTAGTLTLMTVSAGVSASSNLALASYPTIGALAMAISGVGSGWTATTIASMSNFASADLRPITIPLPALNQSASLEVFT
ncbi:MAG: hypothetical protein JO353_06455, partial [Phycisphaerae bacterium]|nr:hypothetical protein [Phycisphaerae bacterium]